MLLAYACALASPRITARGIEASEFPVLADRHAVHSVPAVVIDDRARWVGNVPEPVFIERLLDAASAPRDAGRR